MLVRTARRPTIGRTVGATTFTPILRVGLLGRQLLYKGFTRGLFILVLSCGMTVGAKNGLCTDDACAGTSCPPGSWPTPVDGACRCIAAQVNGTITINPDPFTVGQPVEITVNDSDLRRHVETAETVVILVTSTSGESETVTLTATGVNSTIYIGALATKFGLTAGADNDGTMNAQNGDTLTASYDDTTTPSGGTTTQTDSTDAEAEEKTDVGDTETIISNFLSRRADLITSAEPDLTSRLTGGAGGGSGAPFGFTAEGNSNRFTCAFTTSLSSLTAKRQATGSSLLFYGEGGLAESDADGQPKAPRPAFDFWASGHWANSDDETRSSTFGQFNLGADYLINPSLLVGIIAQFDWMDETDGSNNTSADGFGWMAGPYLVARLQQNLIFDGRVAWGQSDNHVDPLGLYEDKFATNRFLARGQLTGDFRRDKWRFSPHVALIHFQE